MDVDAPIDPPPISNLAEWLTAPSDADSAATVNIYATLVVQMS